MDDSASSSSQPSSWELPKTLDSPMEYPSTPPPTPLNPEPNQQSQPQIPSEEPNPSAEDEEKQGGEGEEEEECGFCLFMKEGGCKKPFIAWEKCVEDAEKSGEDVVEKCFGVTALLRKCMDAHADYYEPILRAEQAMADAIAEDRASKQREEEKLPEPEIAIDNGKVKPQDEVFGLI